MTITTIITHTNPHPDELYAIKMLIEDGEPTFPGVSSAEIEYWPAGTVVSPEENAQLLGEGKLLIGVGGGALDEHPSQTSGRKIGECAASLVAKALGIQDDPKWARLLEHVTRADLKGSGNPFEITSIINRMHGHYTAEDVMAWVFKFLDAELKDQDTFHGLQEEFDREAKIYEVNSGGQKLRIVAIESDAPQMNAFARSSRGGHSAVVIQRNPTTGNTIIFSNRHYNLSFQDVARMVRIAEMTVRGRQGTNDWRQLEQEGTVPGAEEWHYMPTTTGSPMLLNGSKTAPNVPPTALSLDQLVWTICTGLSTETFEKSRQEQCLTGICTSTSQNPCKWYRLGLTRCRKIRASSRQLL